MDSDQNSLDALLEGLIPDVDESPPETPASDEGSNPSEDLVDVQADDAVEETPPPSPVDPAPDYTAQLEAMKAQLAKVSEKAEAMDRLEALARQRQAEAAEAEKFAAWQERMDELENLPAAQKAAEKQRIAAEISSYRAEQYQAQVSERESVAEEAAKVASALHTILPNYLTPEQLNAALADAKYLLQFQSPDAMQSQIARDKALEQRGYERAKAELAKAADRAGVKQAQARIASNADLVGAGAGSPAKGTAGTIDEVLDSIFG